MATRSPSSSVYRTVASSIGKQSSSHHQQQRLGPSSASTSTLPCRTFTSSALSSSSPPPPSLMDRSESSSSSSNPLRPSSFAPPPPLTSPSSSSSAYGTPPSLPPPSSSSSSPFGASPFSSHISRAPRAPPPLRLTPRKPKPKAVDPSSIASSSKLLLFEEETDEYLDAERSLPVVATEWKSGQAGTSSDLSSWQDPRTLPCSTLAAAVRQKNWEEARRQLIRLHERGAGALESHIYVSAAVNSLTSSELETDAERLEWFIHWYSLVPTFAGEERAYLTSLFAQQNTRLCELLLQFETHLEHLSRIVVLFGEKRYAAFFAQRLLPHIVRFGPPEKAMDVLEAVALASGWSTSNPDRNALAVKVIDTLLKSGHFHEAVAALARVRTTYTSVQETVGGKKRSRPPIPQELYHSVLGQIYFYWGRTHPYYRALAQWRTEDYLNDTSDRRRALPMRKDPVQRIEAPTREELPKAIRDLFLPNSRPTAVTLSLVLRSLYLLQPPRYNLLGLMHRRVSGITQISKVIGDESIWIRAEMIRLLQGGDSEGALRLYSSRYIWVGLPTGPRWDEWRRLQTSTQEDVGLGEDVVGDALTGIRRKQVPSPSMIAIALSAIAAMNGQEQTLLEEDYVSFLENCATRDLTRSSPMQDSTPRLSIPGITSLALPSTSHEAIDSPRILDISDSSSSQLTTTTTTSPPTEPTSVALQSDLSLSLSTPSSPPVPITPWTAPPTPFYLPPPLLPTRSNFNVWIHAFSVHHPGQAMSILKDMVDRKIHTDSFDWCLVLEGFVRNNHPELAISGLQTMEKEGGIQINMPPRRLDGRSLLGPIEPLAPGEEEADPASLSSGSLATTSGRRGRGYLGEVTLSEIVRKRGSIVPPTNTEVYVRLIRTAQNNKETEISQLFEEMMANAKVVLGDYAKSMMQTVYFKRGKLRHRQLWERGMEANPNPDAWEKSPWGEPERVYNAKGPDGKRLPHLGRGVMGGWARTAMDDGEPIESRLKRMLPSEGRQRWERKAEREYGMKVQEQPKAWEERETMPPI